MRAGAAGRSAPRDPLRAAEEWFVRRGLPYFVPEQREAAQRALAPRRTVPLALAVGVAAGGAGALLARLLDDVSSAPATLVGLGLLAAAAYAVTAVRAGPVVRWALHRTVGGLRSLVPMMVRAVPLLLIVVIFGFLSGDVWRTAAGLDGAVLGPCSPGSSTTCPPPRPRWSASGCWPPRRTP